MDEIWKDSFLKALTVVLPITAIALIGLAPAYVMTGLLLNEVKTQEQKNP
jgi:hypothetical protein